MERLAEIVERRRGWADIFILCVDRDGEQGGARDSIKLKLSFKEGAFSSPRALGKSLRLGCWLECVYPMIGDGRMSVWKWM